VTKASEDLSFATASANWCMSSCTASPFIKTNNAPSELSKSSHPQLRQLPCLFGHGIYSALVEGIFLALAKPIDHVHVVFGWTKAPEATWTTSDVCLTFRRLRAKVRVACLSLPEVVLLCLLGYEVIF